MNKKKTIIISGGNFNNKGAQAMLFITAREIKEKIDNAEIFFDSQDRYRNTSQYGFEQIDREALRNTLLYTSGEIGLIKLSYKAIRHGIRMLLEKNLYAAFSEYKYIGIVKKTKALFDISGYAVSSEFSNWHNQLYLDIIRGAGNSGINTYLLPQSFGPFDYTENRKGMLDYIGRSLKNVKKLYAREESGIKYLSEIGITAAKRSSDIVLQSSFDDWKDYFGEDQSKKLTFENYVWIVPNTKLLGFRSKDEISELYNMIIEKLLKVGEKVLLVYNSNEDFILCKSIVEKWGECADIQLNDKELNFNEYMENVKKAKYVISSRYHSLVMAFKECVPCIGIGWADKYQELFEILGQRDYVIQIFDMDSNEKLLTMIDYMESNYANEKKTIYHKLLRIREDNCFDSILDEID